MDSAAEFPGAAEAMGALTGPGGEFEPVATRILGARLAALPSRYRALHEVLAEAAARGDRDYIVTATERIGFARFVDTVSAVARALRDQYGVRPGDRVAIAAANSPAWITVFWASVSIGAVATACNAWWSRRELAWALDLTEPRVIVADERRAALLGDASVPVIELPAGLDALTAGYAGAPLPSSAAGEDDPAVIVFTSGTSGRAKGAVHSHRNLLAVVEYHRLNDALAQALGSPVAPEDKRYLLASPLFHIASLHNLAVPRLATGSTVVMHTGAFDADRVLRLIERERVTHWGAMPTMAHRLLDHGDLSRYDLSSLTAFSLSSAPSSPAFKERLRRGLPFAADSLVDSYGLTESCTAVTVATAQDLARWPGTLGRPIVTVELEIRGPDDRPVPDGVEGEVCVRSPFNMLGYWNDDDATARAIDADRWLHTGDLGVLDDGRLRLSSRRSDLIIRGGENVYPAEVEGVLAEHPAVAECVVLGVPHEELGQEVLAVVLTRDRTSVTETELTEHARAALAYYKVPARWRITTEPLPRNATGKVVRRDVPVTDPA
ncbi:class I adenylate-forming enzyme family protein [Actinomadura sp. 9N215]|uniref:class I adenylate-forming enzyme family protein n=1 Tax=Actinomadura sp. 9N215 TaxID=3375150 RepID=UPI0037B8A54E